ncbi:MAG: tryptophan synthase subunit beta, partial [Cyanobacteriota bacterium]|nr:tryptophan synthase subunit beta [Cyanobacteriota bacterium]
MTSTASPAFTDTQALQPQVRPTPAGRFGRFGGQYVPETLMPALAELEVAAAEAWKDPAFTDRLNHLLRTYVGRPTPLYGAERLTA